MYLDCGLGYKRVTKDLSISEALIRRWVKYYENEDISGLEEKREKSKSLIKGRPRKNPLRSEELFRLSAENEYLKSFVRFKSRKENRKQNRPICRYGATLSQGI